MEAQTLESQQAMTPQEALTRLKKGNARFASGQMQERDLMEQVSTTGNGQYPFAIVLGCIDSRVPPELVFDQGIGDIFSARIAGNFANEDIVGSMEFACKVAGARLIFVLGHSSCGAIMGAIDDSRLGNLTGMLSKLKPAIEAVPPSAQERSSQNAVYVQRVAEKNVELTIQMIRDKSPVLKKMLDQGEIEIAGGIYDVKTGVVTFT